MIISITFSGFPRLDGKLNVTKTTEGFKTMIRTPFSGDGDPLARAAERGGQLGHFALGPTLLMGPKN